MLLLVCLFCIFVLLYDTFWRLVATEPVGSRAEEAVKADDAKGLKTCLLLEGGKAGLSDLEKQKLLDVASENGHTCVLVCA